MRYGSNRFCAKLVCLSLKKRETRNGVLCIPTAAAKIHQQFVLVMILGGKIRKQFEPIRMYILYIQGWMLLWLRRETIRHNLLVVSSFFLGALERLKTIFFLLIWLLTCQPLLFSAIVVVSYCCFQPFPFSTVVVVVNYCCSNLCCRPTIVVVQLLLLSTTNCCCCHRPVLSPLGLFVFFFFWIVPTWGTQGKVGKVWKIY